MTRRGPWSTQLRLRLRHARNEEGFTIVELMVALTVLAAAMLILTGTLANALRPLALGKQRAAATSSAQELIEIARSLTWADLGMVDTDTTLPQNAGVDASIVTVAGFWKFGTGCPSATTCEPLQYSTNKVGHPFNPHASTVTRGPTTITRSVYVTGLDTNNDGVIDFKRVTVRAQFARSPIGGVSNIVRLSTLIASTQYGGSGVNGVPLSGTANVANGTVTTSSAVGSGALSSPTLMTLTNPMAQIEGIQTTRSQSACTSRGQILDMTGGSSFGASAVSTLADDDPVTATPSTSSQSTTWAGSPVPSGISAMLVQTSIPSSQSCLSTMLGPNGAVGGDDDLPYSSGAAAGASSLSLQVDTDGVFSDLGKIQLVSMGTSSASGLVDGGPTLSGLVSTASQTSSDVRAMVINAGTLPTPLLATYGLLRVEPLTSTATATGALTGTPAIPSVTAGTMKIWVYDPLLQVPIGATGCTSRSIAPDPLGYCIIQRSVTSGWSFSLTEALVETPKPTLRYSVTITGGAGATSTTVGSSKTVWQARLSPLVATVQLCSTTAADCSTTPGKTMDLQTSIDLGTLVAQAVKGL